MLHNFPVCPHWLFLKKKKNTKQCFTVLLCNNTWSLLMSGDGGKDKQICKFEGWGFSHCSVKCKLSQGQTQLFIAVTIYPSDPKWGSSWVSAKCNKAAKSLFSARSTSRHEHLVQKHHTQYEEEGWHHNFTVTFVVRPSLSWCVFIPICGYMLLTGCYLEIHHWRL